MCITSKIVQRSNKLSQRKVRERQNQQSRAYMVQNLRKNPDLQRAFAHQNNVLARQSVEQIAPVEQFLVPVGQRNSPVREEVVPLPTVQRPKTPSQGVQRVSPQVPLISSPRRTSQFLLNELPTQRQRHTPYDPDFEGSPHNEKELVENAKTKPTQSSQIIQSVLGYRSKRPNAQSVFPLSSVQTTPVVYVNPMNNRRSASPVQLPGQPDNVFTQKQTDYHVPSKPERRSNRPSKPVVKYQA